MPVGGSKAVLLALFKRTKRIVEENISTARRRLSGSFPQATNMAQASDIMQIQWSYPGDRCLTG